MLPLTLFAQREELETIKAQFPDASFVRMSNQQKINISLENQRINIIQDTKYEDAYLDESAVQYAKRSISYNTFFNLLDVKAKTINTENNQLKEDKVENFVTKDEIDDAFYDDSKSVSFILPNLKAGSRTIIEKKEQINNPRFLSPIYFGESFPVANTKIVFEVDKNIRLTFKKFHTDQLNIVMTENTKKNKKIITIEATNTPVFKEENKSPNAKNYVPHLVPVITGYTLNNKEIDLSGDVTHLYSWYQSLVKNINKEAPDPEMVKVVDSLTAGKSTEFEKVKAIYYWAQENVKYIAFEYALGGFVPRDANLVFKKKYGDCKDNSSIMDEMFKIAGINGRITWIGTRSIPYTYSEMPTPLADNHMILTYTHQDKTYFLDATARYQTLDMPTSFIQGKEALVEVDSLHYELKKVPVVEAQNNAWIDKAEFSIKDGTIYGKATTTLRGYQKIDAYYALETKNTQQKKADYYNVILQKGNNKYAYSQLEEVNKFDYENDFKLNYQFEIKDYITSFKDEVYVNMNLARYMQVFQIEKDRKTGMEFEYKNHNEFLYDFTLPEGYELTYLPKGIEIKNDWIQVSLNYEKIGNTIHYKHTVTQDFIELNLEQIKELEKIKSQIEKSYKEVVVIKKKTT